MKYYYSSILVGLFYTSSIFAQIVNIPDANFKNALVNTLCVDINGDNIYDDDVDTNNDGEIQLAEAQVVLSLGLSSKNISSIVGIESFSNLEILDCKDNQIISLDISQNSNLIIFNCYINQISSLDVTQNLNLERLSCGQNELTELDVSQNINLTGLSCSNNQLTNLDLTQNPNLTSLHCERNQIGSLDVSQNLLLDKLICYDNVLTELDVSQNTLLTELWTGYNQLSAINISQNQNLFQLSVSENLLTTIDISQVPNLRFFYIDDNQLVNLDISQNPDLVHLLVQDNNLISLNISNGNNSILENMNSTDNLNLDCILVDDENYANTTTCNLPGTNWCKDVWTNYSEDCVLNVDDFDTIVFEIFPNPTQEFITIESSIEIVELIVFNTSGQIVVSNFITPIIDFSNLSAGFYFVKIKFEDNSITTKKVVKL